MLADPPDERAPAARQPAAFGARQHGRGRRAALAVLADARTDCPFGLVYLLGERRRRRPAGRRARHRVDDELAASSSRSRCARRSTPARVDRDRLATLLPGLASGGASPAGEADVDTAVVLPLVVAGREAPVGAVVLGISPHLRLDDEYRVFLSLAAGQVAAAVADAQAVEAERRRADGAGGARARPRAVLHRRRGHPAARRPRPEVAARRASPSTTSRPAGTLEVGGDWYDVVDLPDGGYGVVVGDVVGRGLAAAAVMGQLRSAGRALLLESRSPAHVLSALDRFAALVPGAAVSTVFCAVDRPPATAPSGTAAPGIRRRSWSMPTARPASSRRPARCRSAVVDDLAAARGRRRAAPGSTLLLYTDGLIERRDRDLDEGMARAVAVLAEGRELRPGGAGRRPHREAPGRRPGRRRRLPRLPLRRLSRHGQGSKR